MTGIWEVLIGWAIVLLCALYAYYRKHEVSKDLIVSSFRCIVQLAFLGYALKWIFSHPSVWISLAVACFMTVNAAYYSQKRVKSKYSKLFLDSLFSTTLSIWPVALLGSLLIDADPWWSAERYLPLLGLLLGNTLNGISLGIENFTHEVKHQSEELLSTIALGASTEEATRSLFKRSLRTSMTPMINVMLSMGLVSIPGMMSGQILAGQIPEQAALVQILFILLMTVGVYLGAILGLNLARRRLFDERGIPCSW